MGGGMDGWVGDGWVVGEIGGWVEDVCLLVA